MKAKESLCVALDGSDRKWILQTATELAGYARWNQSEDWPLLVYGHVLRNHDATEHPLHPGAGDDGLVGAPL